MKVGCQSSIANWIVIALNIRGSLYKYLLASGPSSYKDGNGGLQSHITKPASYQTLGAYLQNKWPWQFDTDIQILVWGVVIYILKIILRIHN